MKLARGFLSLTLVFSLGFIYFTAIPQRSVIAQESNTALQRGYRTGYSDGYMAGYRDITDKQTKEIRRHEDYSNASRAYNQEYGPIEDYKDGYRQGFEAGYEIGFEKRSFDSTIPSDLARRGDSIPETTSGPAATETAKVTQPVSYRSDDNSTIVIPKDAELIIQLQDEISTETSREGDKFVAKVLSPVELSGAVIEGRVEKVVKPGRIKRRSELALNFDRIVFSEERWSNFSGTLVEVMPIKGDNVRRVDEEGTAVGKSTIKPDSVKVGAATGTGAAVGAVAGGPVGAAVGAGVGAAFGVGAVIIERGKHINLNKNQQLRIRSAYDTKIK